MMALLVWLAGCAAGAWWVWRQGLLHVAWQITQVLSIWLWVIGGASCIGRYLKAGVSAQRSVAPRDPLLKRLAHSEEERAALKRAAQPSTGETPS